MNERKYPKYDIIKKNGHGIPYQPSEEVLEFFEERASKGIYLFPNNSVKEGTIVKMDKWDFIPQYKRKDTDWRNSGGIITDLDGYWPAEPMEEYRIIYDLRI